MSLETTLPRLPGPDAEPGDSILTNGMCMELAPASPPELKVLPRVSWSLFSLSATGGKDQSPERARGAGELLPARRWVQETNDSISILCGSVSLFCSTQSYSL